MMWLSRRAVIIGLAVAPFRVRAHTGHGASAWLKSAGWTGKTLRVVVGILNEGGAAVTLRAVTCAAAQAVVFTRQRKLLGQMVEHRVDFLRLDPNELVLLGGGRYRLELVGVEPVLAEVGLMLDFGPDGSLAVAVPLPPPLS